MTARRALVALTGAAIVLGAVTRLVHLDDTPIGDELSTLYIAHDHSLRDVLHLVKSDAEISPPLYFVLAWVGAQIGSGIELIRLPSLIAGLASIPLCFLLARRLFGFSAGMVAAALMALNPFMVYYSTEARPYALAIALLLGSTLAMLIASERRSWSWWALYAALVSLAMYAHYTAVFVLAGQLLWLIWARPAARVQVLVATAAAALAYLPWVPGALDDARSPTVNILSALEGSGISVKLNAIGNWAFGYPYQPIQRIPGQLALIVGVGAFAVIVVGACARLASAIREREPGRRSAGIEPLVLAVVLALATPVGEAVILLTGGTDLLGARNLDLASGGFAVLIAGLASRAGPRVATVGVTALLAVFAVGTLKTLDSTYTFADFHAAAGYIDRNAGPRDVVVDMQSTLLSPVPTTAIKAQLSGHQPVFDLYQPTGPPPFLSGSPPPGPLMKQALRQARGGRLFLVAADGTVTAERGGVAIHLPANVLFRSLGAPPPRATVVHAPGWHLTNRGHWPGFHEVNVYVLSPPPAGTAR